MKEKQCIDCIFYSNNFCNKLYIPIENIWVCKYKKIRNKIDAE